MADWRRFHGDPSPSINDLHAQLLDMLREGRRVFDSAAEVLFSGGDPQAVREEIYSRDQQINASERALRRAIVVHGSVFGSSALSAMLVLMSLVKDAERVGDYSKNIHGLASHGIRFAAGARRDALMACKEQVSSFLGRVVEVFSKQDEAGATALLQEIDEVLRGCDREIAGLLDPAAAHNHAGEVLLLRYFKRIAGHVGNVATSVVMSVDKLDFRPGVPESEQ